MKYNLINCIILLLMLSCDKDSELTANVVTPSILEQLSTNYNQLPEQQIAQVTEHKVYAQYTMPTKVYTHGILGDKIEAKQLVVVVNGIFYEYTLSTDYVFEDIRPRLYDVDGDNQLEFITIRTHINKGAGIVIYKIMEGKLEEYATVSEIGIPNRWLNIVAITDLDNDEIIELAWIQTPHIGGILKVAKIKPGVLEVLSEKSQYSNHAIGERNLCLSAITEQSGQKVIYVPNQSRGKIIGFTFKNKELNVLEEIDVAIDFSKPLSSQYAFSNLIEDEVNCIYIK